MLLTYIKNFALFLFIFVAFNDTLAEDYAGGFVIKGAFGLFVLTHAMELYEMFFKAKNMVVKNFFFLMFKYVNTVELIDKTSLFQKKIKYDPSHPTSNNKLGMNSII